MASSAPDPRLAFRIPSLPPSFYYIPSFISPEEEASLLSKIPPNRWTNLTHRRLQAVASTLTKSNTLLAAPLPSYLLDPIVTRFTTLGIFAHTPHKAPNHVLVNEYKPGEGIMAHEDGPAYAPVVATVSLGGAVMLESAVNPAPIHIAPLYTTHRILCEPRSLLVTLAPAYINTMHCVPAVTHDVDLRRATVANWDLLGEAWRYAAADDVDGSGGSGGTNVRTTRVSLTYRDVLKVSNAASRVLGLGGRR
ncbi:uncharacterized protein BDZ99DRAFT_373947 [Mytilinidion resinicola]|uniref:Fe2OG dioxygenase domain-containing protein n=1 Tax=Mytilinidion resinicola TaxID=574789 RepID=A0A6A6Z9L0_9PEZI|nr:uncharacterized protein BDZ99DRAFT_373947 [Mytilinidion resinicola]KAF2816965.1 hypothetical protein BDZ99DRAFT_373947 [Mytilinidion resinicola]